MQNIMDRKFDRSYLELNGPCCCQVGTSTLKLQSSGGRGERYRGKRSLDTFPPGAAEAAGALRRLHRRLPFRGCRLQPTGAAGRLRRPCRLVRARGGAEGQAGEREGGGVGGQDLRRARQEKASLPAREAVSV